MMIDTLRSVLHFRRIELDPATRRLATGGVGRRPAADRQAAACRAACSTTSTAGPRTSARCATTPTRSPASSSGRACCARWPSIDPSTTLLGRPLPFPLVLAPTGFTRIADPQGELAVARAAERAEPAVHAVDAGDPLDRGGRRRSAAGGSGSRSTPGATAASSRRWSTAAASAGYEALVLTVDTAVLGRRERDVRRGFELPPKIGLGTLLDGAVHPGWTWAFARSEPIVFANVAGAAVTVGDGTDAVTLASVRQHPVRPQPVVGRRRLVPLDVGRPDRRQGHPVGRRRRAGRRARRRRHRPVEPRRPPARLGAGADRSRRRRSPTPSAAAPRSSATAACGGGATSSRPSPSAPRRAWPAGPTSTASAPPASAASTTCWRCSTTDVRRTMALVGAATIADLTPDLVTRPSRF